MQIKEFDKTDHSFIIRDLHQTSVGSLPLRGRWVRILLKGN